MSEVQDRLGSSIKRHSVRLGLFALGTALLLSIVSALTSERIDEQRLAAERAALNAVLPTTAHDNDLLEDAFTLEPGDSRFAESALLGLSQARQAYQARLNGRASGVILPVETGEGYSGTIILLVGISASGNITGVRVLTHNETPGLGDKVEARKSPWIFTFDGRSLGNTDTVLWKVKKDGGDYDQFVGATITPRAVVGAVHKALQFYDLNREQLLDTL